MIGQRFATIEEIKSAFLEEMKTIPKSAYQKSFEDWYKSIISERGYFEGDNIDIDE